jgi:hypothetical protein
MGILRVKATLTNIKPAIWRRIELSDETTLKQFHRILQIAFGWQDYHLHEFISGKVRFGVADPDGLGDGVIPEGRVRIAELLQYPKAQLLYLYDFGDDWYHTILLEAVIEAEAGVEYPRVADGARNSPPEDCGGPYGYQELLDALTDPAHPLFEELREWVGPNFQSEAFSLVDVNKRLRKNRSLAVKR